MARLVSIFKRSLFQNEGFRRGILGTSCSFCDKIKSKCVENLNKKDLNLQQAIDQITSEYGQGSIMWLGRSVSPRQVPVLSTGSFALDIALGIGGFPKGHVVEIYGPEASVLITFAFHLIAEAQKQGGLCLFVHEEHFLDHQALAVAIGVKTENLLVLSPACGVDALDVVDTLIRNCSLSVIVVDNVAALVPISERYGEIGEDLDAYMEEEARLIDLTLCQLSHSLSQSQTTLIIVNKERSKLSMFGGREPIEVTLHRNALKTYASMRLNMRMIGPVKKGVETVGSQVQVKIMKNKFAFSCGTAEFELVNGKGICRELEIINLGLKYKLMSEDGAFYSFNGQSFLDKDALKKFLSENQDAREELIVKLKEKLNANLK